VGRVSVKLSIVQLIEPVLESVTVTLDLPPLEPREVGDVTALTERLLVVTSMGGNEV
jgi:hypothetical protein